MSLKDWIPADEEKREFFGVDRSDCSEEWSRLVREQAAAARAALPRERMLEWGRYLDEQMDSIGERLASQLYKHDPAAEKYAEEARRQWLALPWWERAYLFRPPWMRLATWREAWDVLRGVHDCEGDR